MGCGSSTTVQNNERAENGAIELDDVKEVKHVEPVEVSPKSAKVVSEDVSHDVADSSLAKFPALTTDASGPSSTGMVQSQDLLETASGLVHEGDRSTEVPTVSPHRRPSSQVSGSNGMDEIAEDDIVEEDAQGMLQELEGIMASMEEELLGSEHREKTDATSPQATPQRLDQNDEELMAEILQDLSDIKLT